MRESAEISTANQPSTLICGLAILAALTLNIAPVRASDDHLPKKAKAVAEKLIAFEKTATPAATKSKRKEVVQYLGALLNEEASRANLDGALAVKALIEKIEGPKKTSKPVAKAVTSKTTAAEGRSHERFSIDSEAKRRLEFPFNIEDDRTVKTIHCEIGEAGDDSGDNGLEYALIDPSGKVAKQGKLNSSSSDLVTHRASRGGEWKVIINDSDTTFDGNHPGNNGSIRVTIKRTRAAVASNAP